MAAFFQEQNQRCLLLAGDKEKKRPGSHQCMTTNKNEGIGGSVSSRSIVFRFHQDRNIEENVGLEEASANVLDFQHILQGDAG